MKLVKYLANLGYGTRRDVTEIVDHGLVTRRDGSIVRDGDTFEHSDLLINGTPCDPSPGAVLALHKPTGFVCSAKETSRLIYELLPSRLLARSPIMAPVGRLDRDTSGLLLLTDDGKLNHRLTSPRAHLPKVYVAELASDLRGDVGAIFASGTLLLNGETVPLRAASLEPVDRRRVHVTLYEGRYHQVRRMFAAVGNHVVSLRRQSIGGLDLGDLEVGRWRELSLAEVAALLP
ncbi:MAG: pseudouridine synthase [bacterium]